MILYPQLDRDNISDNPASSKTFARRSPVGSVVTNDLKKSLTRETADSVLKDFKIGLPITNFIIITECWYSDTYIRQT